MSASSLRAHHHPCPAQLPAVGIKHHGPWDSIARQPAGPGAVSAAAAARATVALHHRWPPARHSHMLHVAAEVSGAAAGADLDVDVCILGAGIIGLCTALALLRADSSLAVALVDRAVPCSGATGAGQGYLWMAHRDPASPLWHLAEHSKQMWQELLPAVPQLTPAAVEWQAAGSMLLATSEGESEGLRQRLELLRGVGLDASLLPAAAARQLEPALALSAAGSALLVPSDVQVNGLATAAALQRACEAFEGRFTALFNEGASKLAAVPSGRIGAVHTEARRIGAALGVVVAMGAWSGPFLAQQLHDERWAGAFQPRRGLLLEMAPPRGMARVAHGLMEMGYAKHYSRTLSSNSDSSSSQEVPNIDITFTATTSASGTLLVGSSREFAGFDPDAPEAIVASIMQRAAHFLPSLAAARGQDVSVRAGPRPYATAGSPMVGAVPSTPGLLVAAGHEGSGLMLAPATAALICERMLGRPSGLEAVTTDSLRVPF